MKNCRKALFDRVHIPTDFPDSAGSFYDFSATVPHEVEEFRKNILIGKMKGFILIYIDPCRVCEWFTRFGPTLTNTGAVPGFGEHVLLVQKSLKKLHGAHL